MKACVSLWPLAIGVISFVAVGDDFVLTWFDVE